MWVARGTDELEAAGGANSSLWPANLGGTAIVFALMVFAVVNG